jgi:SAM-dependent methyltransferase
VNSGNPDIPQAPGRTPLRGSGAEDQPPPVPICAPPARPSGAPAREAEGACLAGHPDRLRWNDKYGPGYAASFAPHPLAAQALSLGLPDGPVADLACGPSGSALLAAAAGHPVTAVDISEIALGLLAQEARRRGLADLITIRHADLAELHLPRRHYALVLCTGFWDRAVFAAAARSVAPGGLLGWEAFTAAALRTRPKLSPDWCLAPGEPASLLPADFEVTGVEDLPDNERGAKRRLLARRMSTPAPANG